ncbi:MAG: hypothetical protein LBH43_21910 [Treponema sp.]|jgi:hypothetical protein|nr:hypothetical protein [Treponema sp.]
MSNFIKRLPVKLFLFMPLMTLLLIVPVKAQETFDFLINEPEKPPLANPDPEPPPRIFREFSLDMELDELKEALKKDSLFHFQGDRDVSLLPLREQTLVETTGGSFIRRAFFQLADGKVFTMAFIMDTRLIDHYSVFVSFLKKYGEPKTLNPKETVWEDDNTRVSLERPLTVKYVDKAVFNNMIEKSQTLQSQQVFQRQEFLNEF